MTSTCGVGTYRDELSGKQYAGNAFISEPVHNLVRCEVFAADGATVAGHRASSEQESEFPSSNNWFRPAQVRAGPYGVLYVVDMYRYAIDHPCWISPEMLTCLDVRAGADKGRIYRIV